MDLSALSPPSDLLSLAFTGNTWTAIGSIGTAVAVLVALVSFLFELRGRQRTEVAQIRELVQRTATRARQFVSVLKDGYPLLDAAWHTALSVRTQAGHDATAAEMRAQIGVPVVTLTAAVEGWATSPSSEQLQQALESLNVADELTGDLSLLSASAELLRRIVKDGYSPSIFIRMLDGYPAEKFVSEHQDEDIDGLTRTLTEHLQGNSSLYFQVRYEAALEVIVEFVTTAAAAIVSLRPRDLIRVSRARSAASVEADFTQQMREGLAGLQGMLSPAVISSLESNVDKIETLIDKASAEARLQSKGIDS